MVLTEAELIKVKEAAERLDSRYPLLAQRGSLLESIQPRYSGVIERVPDGQYDQVGSLLGSFLLYAPADEEMPDVPFGFGAELAQLDLDNVARVTGRNVGSGLLQVFMREDYWSDGADLGSLAIRVIPRRIVDQMELDEDYADEPEVFEEDIPEVFEEDIQEQAEIDKLREMDPSEAKSRLYLHHYEMGCLGSDWLISSYYVDDYDSVPHEIADTSDPLQIIRWEKVGYEMPNPCLWSSDDFDIESIYPSFRDDTDFKIIENAMNEDLPGLVVGLFASNYDDAYEVEQHPELGWKKLFHFDGPVSSAVVDVHTVYFRQIDGGFEYTGACIRYKS